MPDSRKPKSRENHSKRVLKGFGATATSTFALMALQLVYAALVSRVLPPSAFGDYAVAVSGIGLLTMLGGSSLALSAARRESDSLQPDRALVSLSLVIGGCAALIGVMAANAWALLWGAPGSTEITRVLALSIPSSVVSAVLAGILRRRERTSSAAIRTAVGQFAGLVVGLSVVLASRDPWSLAVSSVVGLTIATWLLASAMPRGSRTLAWPTAAVVEDVLYAVKFGAMNVLRYGTALVPVWSISRFAGVSSLGAYDRATTLLTNPLLNLQASLSYVLFPELRPNGPVSRSPRALTDLLILVAWPTVIVGVIGYFAAPLFIALLLGPTWQEAADLAGVALLLGVVPMVGIPLGSALEALGRFRVTWLSWLVGLAVISIGVALTALSSTPLPAMLGVLAATVVRTILYALAASRARLISPRGLFAGTRLVLVLQAPVVVVLVVLTSFSWSSDLVQLAAVSAVGALELAVLGWIRSRTAFGTVARRYGLPGSW